MLPAGQERGRAGPLPGPHLAGLVRPHHLVDARPGLARRQPGPGRKRGTGTSDPGMIGYTLAEIRRLLIKITQQQPPGSRPRLGLVPVAPKTPVPGPRLPLPATRLRPHLSAVAVLVRQQHFVIRGFGIVLPVLTDDDLAAWVAGLDDLFALVAGRFGRVEPRRRARGYVRGLLAPLAVKNGWTLAEAAGDATPDGMQRLLNAAAWDADGVRDDVRGYVARHLGVRGRRAGGGRDRVPEEGHQVGRGAAAVFGHRGAGRELPAGRVLRLRHGQGPRPDRPRAVPAEVVDR